ncbi:MAG: hypothetical protein PUK70_03535 [Bacteroidales bacterium]|nr:hypothetical protein [Bacteroidales bacterium]MDY6000818.1 hypothetical protein [Candidatus Cryptobacteroides sp.]
MALGIMSIWRMEELVKRIARLEIHLNKLVTHKFTLEHCSKAYARIVIGKCGKVAAVFDEKVK